MHPSSLTPFSPLSFLCVPSPLTVLLFLSLCTFLCHFSFPFLVPFSKGFRCGVDGRGIRLLLFRGILSDELYFFDGRFLSQECLYGLDRRNLYISAFMLAFPQSRYLIFNRSILHQIFIPVSRKLLCPLNERVSPRCLLHPGSKSFPPENHSILAGWISCGIFSKPIREHQARGRGEAVVQFGSSKLRS